MSKKRPPPKHIAQLRQALSAPSDRTDWPADLAWAGGVLDGEVGEPPAAVEPEVVVALVQELLGREAYPLIASLAQLTTKTVFKPARAALHRLRTQGIQVKPSPARPKESGTGQQLVQTVKSFATGHDPAWEREVGLVDESSGGINLVLGHISATAGLQEVHVLHSMTRKRYRQLLRELKGGTAMALIDHPEARWLIEDAARLRREAGRGMPPGYAQASQMLGAAPGGEHPGLEIEATDASNQQLVTLYDEPELRGWWPDRDFLHRLELQLHEVFTSKLMIDEQQRKNQISNVVDRLLEEFFTEPRCQAAYRLLLDATHLAARCDRGEVAARIRAGAEVFLLPGERLVVHPFVRHFLERLVNTDNLPELEPPEEQPEDQDQPPRGGLIIP